MVQMQNNLCTPLQTPYAGPYAVLQFKHFQIGNRQDNVSIYRLKPAYVDEEDAPVQVANDQPVPARFLPTQRSQRLRD